MFINIIGAVLLIGGASFQFGWAGFCASVGLYLVIDATSISPKGLTENFNYLLRDISQRAEQIQERFNRLERILRPSDFSYDEFGNRWDAEDET